jgi:hypothetical protein
VDNVFGDRNPVCSAWGWRITLRDNSVASDKVKPDEISADI